jgi:hypothetical protein
MRPKSERRFALREWDELCVSPNGLQICLVRAAPWELRARARPDSTLMLLDWALTRQFESLIIETLASFCVVGKPEVIQLGIERIKDEPSGKSRLIARRVIRYFAPGLSASYST